MLEPPEADAVMVEPEREDGLCPPPRHEPVRINPVCWWRDKRLPRWNDSFAVIDLCPVKGFAGG